MWPLGQYERMVYEIKRRENQDIPVTFGILIADYRQHLSREYILNYIDRFNYKSDKYINFYLPGYLEENFCNSQEKITVKGKKYYFDASIYMEFLMNLENDFGIDHPYTPVLLLIEYSNGHFNKSNKILIELDSDSMNIKKTGNLFEKVFNIAEKEVNLKKISKSLRKETFNLGILDNIVKALDNTLISVIYDEGKNIKKYKVV